jgi:subtilase family serine protease
LVRLIKSRASIAVFLAVFILLLGFPGIASTVKAAAPRNDWKARTFFVAHPLSHAGLDPLSPSQIISAYNLGSATGGHGTTIAIVDAYDDPTIANDLATFNSRFGLLTSNFVKYKMSTTISVDSGWALEISLDVEWAHAIAPQATILLVEATSNSLTDLLAAVSYATSQTGVKAVSMSWGGSEFSTETSYDSYFSTAGITFFASSGDSGAGVIWPSSSPNVVGVGGTTLDLGSSGAVTSETAWSGSGGGVSAYETHPTYQTNYGLTYARRAVPDVSYDADPNTGVYVYDSTPYQGSSGWWVVGGTSAGAPQWAAIQALGLSANNNYFYQDAAYSYASYFRDITSGSNGYPAGPGYDLVTGLGSPLTTNYVSVTTPTVPYAPQNLKATAGNAQVALTWSAPLSNGGSPITSYNVYRSTTSGGEGQKPLATLGNVLAYIDTTVTNGQTYYYQVTASNSVGESIRSNEASATPSAAKTLGVTVVTDKTAYSRGSNVYITVTVKDSTTGSVLQGASVKVTVYYPNGSVAGTGSGTTGSNGTVQFTYRIPRYAQTGTYKVAATASLSGYQGGTGQTTFTAT